MANMARPQQISQFSDRLLGGPAETPYRDGTTHVIFEPLDFIAKLAALAWPAAYEATHKSDALSWGFRAGRPSAQQQVSCACHSCQEG